MGERIKRNTAGLVSQMGFTPESDMIATSQRASVIATGNDGEGEFLVDKQLQDVEDELNARQRNSSDFGCDRRRRMAVREFSSRRDSPVLLRLLEEIREANRK